MSTHEIAIPGLSTTPDAVLPFDAAVRIRSFHLHRPHGDDLIVYATDGNRAEGATRQYLGHAHEAVVGEAAEGAAVIVHAADAAEASRSLQVHDTFDGAFAIGDDFEAIPVPGHTPVSTAYLWRTGDHRVLFSGDTLLPGPDGRWQVVVLDFSDAARYADSLDRLATLDFDVLAPWGTPAGHPAVEIVDPDEARRRVIAARDRVHAGRRR